MPSPTRTELVKWLSTIDVAGRTLDVGGDVWSMRGQVKSFEGEYKTIDEKSWNLNNYFIKTDHLREFDNIFCLEVMQFVYKPDVVLDNLNLIMKPSGKLYLSFHLTHPPMKDHDYLRYTEKGIRKLLNITGIRINSLYEPIQGYYLLKCSR